MKARQIIADPLALDRAGITSCKHAAVFVHMGRCGLVGSTIARTAEALQMCPSTVRSLIGKLEEDKLIVRVFRANSKGRTVQYVVTVKGWEILTKPADLAMFPWAMKEVV